MAPVLRKLLDETGVAAHQVDDILIGKAAGETGRGLNSVRIASFLAGFPKDVSCAVLSRACSSGLQSIAMMHAAIKNGHAEIGIAGGVESMTFDRIAQVAQAKTAPPEPKHPEAANNPLIDGCYWTMGQTSEEVARQNPSMTREKQDYYGYHSQKRAIEARDRGVFREEVLPLRARTGELLEADEGLRATTTEALAKLKPAFGADGKSTAGNSSQVSDGAAAVMMMKRSKARELGLKPLGTMISFDVVGVDPRVMGIGPAVAIPRALKKAGLTKDQIDLWEINEAFASQFGYTVESLGINYDKVNVNGGAIAIGHPLAVSGTRMTITLLKELRRRKAKYGVVSMCIGGGMGAAAVFRAE